MKNYTIGIYFDASFSKVALILKNRPEWQAGKYNFPGGHIEDGETGHKCVAREFFEECGVNTHHFEWHYIADMFNKTDGYNVQIFTLFQDASHGELMTNEDQDVDWFEIIKLPKNIISNLHWLTHFALNYWKQGNFDNIKFGKFEYENK